MQELYHKDTQPCWVWMIQALPWTDSHPPKNHCKKKLLYNLHVNGTCIFQIIYGGNHNCSYELMEMFHLQASQGFTSLIQFWTIISSVRDHNEFLSFNWLKSSFYRMLSVAWCCTTSSDRKKNLQLCHVCQHWGVYWREAVLWVSQE